MKKNILTILLFPVVGFGLFLNIDSAQAANILFKSNFGPGVTVEEPHGYYTNGKGAWQLITGTDQETGFSWPITAFDATWSPMQLITSEIISSSTIGDHIHNEIREVVGPDGNNTHELFQNVKIKGPVPKWDAQDPLMIHRPWTKGDVDEIYYTYWHKNSSDLKNNLSRGGASIVQSQFKTGGYLNKWHGDYRISTYVAKDNQGELYWRTKGDNVANGPWSRVDYWVEENHEVAVPVGEWFKYEVYWKRSDGDDGRHWVAVNGEVVTDHHGPNMGDEGLPITRIMLTSQYTGGLAPVEGHTTGLEIWDSFPCGVGKSCYENPWGNGPGSSVPKAEPTLTFNANKNQVMAGEDITLSWVSQNTSTCTASGDWEGDFKTSGSFKINNIQKVSTYSLVCKGEKNTKIEKNVTVQVDYISSKPGATPTTPSVNKWHPGIYVKIEDWQLKSPVQMEKIYQELADTPQLRGVKVVMKWGRYETRTNDVSTYNFTQIENILSRLATMDNKHLIVAIAWREFKSEQ